MKCSTWILQIDANVRVVDESQFTINRANLNDIAHKHGEEDKQYNFQIAH